jgi:hypothetical protein
MISAEPKPGFDTLAARLVAMAKAIAEARAQESALAQQGSPTRWRSARLLWPLFTKG